ncbi:hypothetical protein [Acinetobacter sp.]|uniref:hypothetical protein n=1 Tax=Acinetobacter sp. TaxID=472 RepID=UPI00333EFBC1
MPKDFQNWVALLANIGTIIALIIAFVTWITWKKQQNYSFVRDKIFEVELVYARLLTSMQNYLNIFKDELPFKPNRIAIEAIDITNVFLREHREDINKYTSQYEDALFRLYILEVKYKEEFVANHSIIHSRFDRYISKLKECKTEEAVLLLHQEFNQLLVDEKMKGLEELQRVRREI